MKISALIVQGFVSDGYTGTAEQVVSFYKKINEGVVLEFNRLTEEKS